NSFLARTAYYLLRPWTLYAPCGTGRYGPHAAFRRPGTHDPGGTIPRDGRDPDHRPPRRTTRLAPGPLVHRAPPLLSQTSAHRLHHRPDDTWSVHGVDREDRGHSPGQ